MQPFAKINLSLRLLLWCCLVIGVVIGSLGIRQVDLWWQLPEGISILRDGRLPVQPPASFGIPSHPYIDEYVLYEIILALVYRAGGFVGIGLVFAVIYLLIFAIPLAAARGKNPDLISLFLFAMALLFMINRLEQRPEVPGVLCLVLLLCLLRSGPARLTPGFLLKLCLLLALWSNLHSSYLVGLAALCVWLLDRLLVAKTLNWRRAALVGAAALAAVTINPYGWHRIAFTLEQETDAGSNVLSQEMWPITQQPPTAAILLLIAASVLLAAFLDRKRPPPWLIGVALLTFLMSLHSLRHISFLAAALLTLYADRQASPGRSGEGPNQIWTAPAATLLLTACCIFTLIFDFHSLYQDVRHLIFRRSWGREDQGFAPSLVNILNKRNGGDAGVLCGYGEGSYLTFAGGGRLRPLLDSGLGHFDDDTKRSYFLLEHEPEALDLALSRLAVQFVLVTRPIAGWTPLLAGRKGWRLVACDGHGFIFQSTPGKISLDQGERRQIESVRDSIEAQGDHLWAFCYSSLIDPIPASLEILDRSDETDWPEAFFNDLRRWIGGVPVTGLNAFLTQHPFPHNALLHELILRRAGARGNPAMAHSPPSQLGKSLRILDLLDQGDLMNARKDFAALPHPPASTLYYEVRDRLRRQTGEPEAPAQPRDDWQDWNRGGQQLFDRLAPSLNRQLATPGW